MPQGTIDEAFNLAVQAHQAGRLREAEQLLAQQPEHAPSLHRLGMIALQVGRAADAVNLIRRAIVLDPYFADACNTLGVALQAAGHLHEAIAAFQRAVSLRPTYAEAYNNLGNGLKASGQLDDAIAAYRRAIALKPNYADAPYNLGIALQSKGLHDEAIAAYRRAIEIKPHYIQAHSNLAIALNSKGLLDESIAACRRAISIDSRFPEPFLNLGNALKDRGNVSEAIAAYRQAITLRPGYTEADSNLVYTLYFDPAYDGKSIAAEHQRWNLQHAEPLRKDVRAHSDDRNPDRRLRIGYVSPDFRGHPIGLFLLPLLENHDRERFEVFAYDSTLIADAMTRRLTGHVDVWRRIADRSDAQAADLIRDDRIDILVDLTLHMSHNRLLIFARKLAPVQVTYLAYAGTSGLSTMDYRLSDAYLDPPDGDESVYSEQTFRLPETYWCYRPLVSVPGNAQPAIENGFMTFGCLNNFCKVNEPLMKLWARILTAIPRSRLILHAREGTHRQSVIDFLQRDGIDSSRITFIGTLPKEAYFESYHSIDIALDTTPYGGGTTTCDALWMGVPVVSLAGKTAVGRGGLSILSNLGLPELVGRTPDEYVEIATRLAGDLPRLQKLRETLRRRMEASPLMDAPKFARGMEAAYRQMWRTWCGSQK